MSNPRFHQTGLTEVNVIHMLFPISRLDILKKDSSDIIYHPHVVKNFYDFSFFSVTQYKQNVLVALFQAITMNRKFAKKVAKNQLSTKEVHTTCEPYSTIFFLNAIALCEKH